MGCSSVGCSGLAATGAVSSDAVFCGSGFSVRARAGRDFGCLRRLDDLDLRQLGQRLDLVEIGLPRTPAARGSATCSLNTLGIAPGMARAEAAAWAWLAQVFGEGSLAGSASASLDLAGTGLGSGLAGSDLASSGQRRRDYSEKKKKKRARGWPDRLSPAGLLAATTAAGFSARLNGHDLFNRLRRGLLRHDRLPGFFGRNGNNLFDRLGTGFSTMTATGASGIATKSLAMTSAGCATGWLTRRRQLLDPRRLDDPHRARRGEHHARHLKENDLVVGSRSKPIASAAWMVGGHRRRARPRAPRHRPSASADLQARERVRQRMRAQARPACRRRRRRR